MLKKFKSFVNDQNGAVTVDWVVLCAGIVALAASIVVAMQTGTLTLSSSVTDMLSNWSF
ncbi:MAG: Flp pilus assembly pilin Flp [Ascidiaceihabitans sp.]|jgi:Flp pilus assembly pilin Flp